MPPPPRPQSIHSWWSDSNPPGATIPLHPLASRLSKLLYHRQVIGVIKQYSSSPLSESQLDAFVPYLPSNLLWNSTKVLILKEILITSKFDLGAQAVVKTELPHVLVGLLHCQDEGIIALTCSVLESIFSGSRQIPGAHDLNPASIYVELKGSLLLFLRSPTKAVRLSAIHALNEITGTENSKIRFEDALDMQAALSILVESLQSSSSDESASPGSDELAEGLSRFLSNICSPLDTKVVQVILPYLESQHVSSVAKATILSTFSQYRLDKEILTHKEIVTHTALLRVLNGLVESSDRDVLQWTCSILCNIARHHSPMFSSEELIHKIVPALISVLRRSDNSGKALQHTVEALSHISSLSESGACEIVWGNALPFLVDLQRFQDPQILRSTYQILYDISSHEDLVSAVVRQIPGKDLISVLGSPKDDETASAALSVLTRINQTDRLAFVSELKTTIAGLVRLLSSPNGVVIRRACSGLVIIARYHQFNPQLHRSDGRPALITLSSHPQIADAATDILSQSNSDSRETVGQRIRGQIVPHLLKFLSSPDTSLQRDACSVLAQLANFCDITLDKQQTIETCRILVPFLSRCRFGLARRGQAITDHGDIGIISESVHLVAQITRWPHVALFIAESTTVVPMLVPLLSSTEVGILHEACTVFAHLALFLDRSTILHVLLPIVVLCSHTEPTVRSAARFAFSEIIHSPKLAKSVLHSEPEANRIGSLEWLCEFLFAIVNQRLRLVGDRLLGEGIMHSFRSYRFSYPRSLSDSPVIMDVPWDVLPETFEDSGPQELPAAHDMDVFLVLVDMAQSSHLKSQMHLACVVISFMCLEIVRREPPTLPRFSWNSEDLFDL